jgi:hypothetical protein
MFAKTLHCFSTRCSGISMTLANLWMSALKIQAQLRNVTRKRSSVNWGENINFFENAWPKTLVRRSAAEFRYHCVCGSFDGVEIFRLAPLKLMFTSLGEIIFNCAILVQFCSFHFHLNCNLISVKGKMILEHSDIFYALVKVSVRRRKLFLELLSYDAEPICQRLSIRWWDGRFRRCFARRKTCYAVIYIVIENLYWINLEKLLCAH